MTLSNVQDIYRTDEVLNHPENYFPVSEDIQTLRNLQEGVYTVDNTIKLPWVFGNTIKGVGSARYYGLHGAGWYAGYTSNLLWSGDDSSAMFQLSGESTLVEKVTVGNAPVGILLDPLLNEDGSVKTGIGTGKVVVRDCVFNGCKTAFEVGKNGNNNDEVTLDHVTVEGCETLLRLLNPKAMGFRIRSALVRNGSKNSSGNAVEYAQTENVTVKNIIDVYAGGVVYVEDMTVIHASDSVLRLNGTEGEHYDATIQAGAPFRIGNNNGFFSLKNIKIDLQAGTPKIVEMSDRYNARIIVENVQVPTKPWIDAIEKEERGPQIMYKLMGPVDIAIRDCNLFEGCIAWDGTSEQFPHIVLDRCGLSGSPTSILEIMSKSNSKGKCYLSTRDCYINSTHAPLPDITSYIDAE